ncbi:hypothetical protein ARMSODRAFT_157319 [Armillaria solidipes]|uniref:Uncharacterized protein n=1 Tax=Armillaria solidipes TaxID=1076256 RepID=A0A2H3BTF9_9AGAR|nr:hypothetical protein ARMSODRAFT_157319 [Armillaria solidipes]
MPANYQQLRRSQQDLWLHTLPVTSYYSCHSPFRPTMTRLADIISSKAPPLPKEVAEELLNEKENKLVRTAINASSADPVLASTLENAFTEALSKVESNTSYKTVLHRRRILTLWAIIIDDVIDCQVKGEDVWNVKVVLEHALRLLYVLARDLRGRDGKSPIKATTLSTGKLLRASKDA